MECPHCKYQHGFSWYKTESQDEKEFKNVNGEDGEFYRLPVKMQRGNRYGYDDEFETLYACPSCSKTFIDIL